MKRKLRMVCKLCCKVAVWGLNSVPNREAVSRGSWNQAALATGVRVLTYKRVCVCCLRCWDRWYRPRMRIGQVHSSRAESMCACGARARLSMHSGGFNSEIISDLRVSGSDWTDQLV
eukprot:1445877-Rhodomonas_salina.1